MDISLEYLKTVKKYQKFIKLLENNYQKIYYVLIKDIIYICNYLVQKHHLNYRLTIEEETIFEDAYHLLKNALDQLLALHQMFKSKKQYDLNYYDDIIIAIMYLNDAAFYINDNEISDDDSIQEIERLLTACNEVIDGENTDVDNLKNEITIFFNLFEKKYTEYIFVCSLFGLIVEEFEVEKEDYHNIELDEIIQNIN